MMHTAASRAGRQARSPNRSQSRSPPAKEPTEKKDVKEVQNTAEKIVKEIRDLRLLTDGVNDSTSLHQRAGGIPIKDFVKKVFQGCDAGIGEYGRLRQEGSASNSTFKAFEDNPAKNRYIDIKCYDHTRVVLNDGLGSNYIHANYVDGYKYGRMYICCQGPLKSTFMDFWRMIWQEQVMVISMTTKCMELGKAKCGQYWPNKAGNAIDLGVFTIVCKRIMTQRSYSYTEIILRNNNVNQSRAVVHLLYTAWPDCGVPLNSNVFLSYLDVLRKTQMAMIDKRKPAWTGGKLGPPIVVHCSAGIGRSGTLCAVDICCRKLLETGRVDIEDTVRKLRSQRSEAVQKPEQYMFVCLTVIQFAITYNLMHVTEEVELQYHAAQDEAVERSSRLRSPPAPPTENEYGIPENWKY